MPFFLGSVTTKRELIFATCALTLNDDIWPMLGAKPIPSLHSECICNSEPWVLVRSSRSSLQCSLQPRSPDMLQLSHKFQALDSGDGLCSPVGFYPDDHPSSARASAPELVGGSSPPAAQVQPPRWSGMHIEVPLTGWWLLRCCGPRLTCCGLGPAPQVFRCAHLSVTPTLSACC
eukprot:superscaffoldBa00005245_g20090